MLGPLFFASSLLDQVVQLHPGISLEQERGAPAAQPEGIICKVQISERTLSVGDAVHSPSQRSLQQLVHTSCKGVQCNHTALMHLRGNKEPWTHLVSTLHSW